MPPGARDVKDTTFALMGRARRRRLERTADLGANCLQTFCVWILQNDGEHTAAKRLFEQHRRKDGTDGNVRAERESEEASSGRRLQSPLEFRSGQGRQWLVCDEGSQAGQRSNLGIRQSWPAG